ncbi:MAG: hypothetical protein AAGF82_02535 [Pseudomonadota bacterium]
MSVALYDYARGCQDILGHEVMVYFSEPHSDPAVLDKYREALQLVPLPRGRDHCQFSEPHKLDFCYFIRDGRERLLGLSAGRTGIHAVFRHFEPHGDVYAYVSDWLSDWMTGGQAPAVPHMVSLPDDPGSLRPELGISKDAFVVGRYGGFDQFNIPFAHAAVVEALARRSNLHFLFVNTQKFLEHPRAHFLPPVINPAEKSRFINSCDAGLNAKKIGESFGLAIVEFLHFGKPVFSWAGGMDQNHVCLTPKRDWNYRTRRDLLRLLTEYVPDPADSDTARNSVECYRPEPVMRRFESAFLSGDYSAKDLRLTKTFKAKRLVQEKLLRAKFRLWKSL